MLAELSPQLARADAGPGGQRVQVAVVQRAQLDQLQRARHAGGQPRRGPAAARFPGGSAGRDGSRPPRGRGRGVEDDIARQGRARRTDRTAVDARGLDRGEEASVVAGVAHADGAVAGVVIEIHAAMLTPVRDGVLAVFGPCCPADTDVRKPRAGVRRGPYILLRMPVLAARSRRLSPAIRSLFLSAMEVRAMSAHLFRRTPEDAHRRDAGADRRARTAARRRLGRL